MEQASSAGHRSADHRRLGDALDCRTGMLFLYITLGYILSIASGKPLLPTTVVYKNEKAS